MPVKILINPVTGDAAIKGERKSSLKNIPGP